MVGLSLSALFVLSDERGDDLNSFSDVFCKEMK